MALSMDELLRRIFESPITYTIQAAQISNYGIQTALEKLYPSGQILFPTDLFNGKSPFQTSNVDSQLQYVNEIERIIAEEGCLTKPIVFIYKNEVDSSWDLMVILPPKNLSSTSKIFYRNSSKKSEIPALIKTLLVNEIGVTNDSLNVSIKGGVLKNAECIAQRDFEVEDFLQPNEGGWWALVNAMLIIREENEKYNIHSWASVSHVINIFFQENGIDLHECISSSICGEETKNEAQTKSFAYNNVFQPHQNSNIKAKKDLKFEVTEHTHLFNEILNSEDVLVDKTLLIKDILGDPNYATLIARPRKWGKTLNMNMLRAFLHPQRDEYGDLINKKIFSVERRMLINDSCADLEPRKLAIATVDNGLYLEKFAGKYPVIFITFTSINFKNGENLDTATHAAFGRSIAAAFEDHRDVWEAKKALQEKEFDHYTQRELDEFWEYLNYNPKSDLVDSIYFLSVFLKNHYKQEPFIIIDEVDAPFNKLFSKKIYNTVFDKMEDMIENWTKNNMTNVKKVVMTGTLGNYVTDHLYNDNVLGSRFSKHFGFTETEINALLKQCLVYETENELKQYKEDIASWYDGYNISGIKIYNPHSIMNCLKAAQTNETQNLRPYWIEPGRDPEFENLLRTCFDKEKLAKLMRSGYVTLDKWLSENVVLSRVMEQETAFFSFLIHSGYLTSIPKSKSAINYPRQYIYTIPNKEVKSYVFDILFPSLLEKIAKKLPNLDLNSLVSRLNLSLENAQEYSNIIKSEVLSSWDNRDIDFQVIPAEAWFFAGIASQNQRHTLWNGEANKYGYKAGALYIPIKDQSTTVVVHEYKKIFSTPMISVNSLALETLRQIYDRCCMHSALRIYKKNDYYKYFTRVIVRAIIFYHVEIEQKWNLQTIEHEYTIDEAIRINNYFKKNKNGLNNCKTGREFVQLLNEIKTGKESIDKEYKQIDSELRVMNLNQDNSLKRKHSEDSKPIKKPKIGKK